MAKEKAIEEDVDPVFENESEEEVEFQDAVEGESDPDAGLPEDVKKTSKKDLYERVKALEKKATESPDPTERISKAFETAVGKIRPSEPAAVVQAPGEPDAAFRERLKKDLFDEDKVEGVLNEAIDRRLGPRFAQTAELNYKQAEKIMELDGTTGSAFKKYRADIDRYMKEYNLPRNPMALEYAFNQIRVLHIDEIAQEQANAILEAERKKSSEGGRRSPIPLESGGGSGGGGAPRKRIVTITQEDRRIADERGVDASVVAAQRSARMS